METRTRGEGNFQNHPVNENCFGEGTQREHNGRCDLRRMGKSLDGRCPMKRRVAPKVMRRVNLNDTKLTIRVSTDAKRKAAEIAKRRGLSISQLVDELIRQAEETKLDEDTLRTIVSEELEKWGRSASTAKGAGQSA